jgi:hypothetical protein
MSCQEHTRRRDPIRLLAGVAVRQFPVFNDRANDQWWRQHTRCGGQSGAGIDSIQRRIIGNGYDIGRLQSPKLRQHSATRTLNPGDIPPTNPAVKAPRQSRT